MDYRETYARHAERYDSLVAAEDSEQRLLPALQSLAKLKGARVLEVGVGTGRLTRLLAPLAAHITGVEREPGMLAVARRHLAAYPSCRIVLGELDALPVAAGSFDVALAGWVFGQLRQQRRADWRSHIGRGLAELQRALRPRGTLIVIEALGTGFTEPAPPSPELADYYAWLEREQGFTRRALRTDYAFASVARAAELTRFFFGEELARRIEEEALTQLPECTGIWWRT